MAQVFAGAKLFSEPMLVSLLMHICVSRPHWVKNSTMRKCGFRLWVFRSIFIWNHLTRNLVLNWRKVSQMMKCGLRNNLCLAFSWYFNQVVEFTMMVILWFISLSQGTISQSFFLLKGHFASICSFPLNSPLYQDNQSIRQSKPAYCYRMIVMKQTKIRTMVNMAQVNAMYMLILLNNNYKR